MYSLLLQLFELGPDGGDNEGDGELLAETEEVAFECAARWVLSLKQLIHWLTLP